MENRRDLLDFLRSWDAFEHERANRIWGSVPTLTIFYVGYIGGFSYLLDQHIEVRSISFYNISMLISIAFYICSCWFFIRVLRSGPYAYYGDPKDLSNHYDTALKSFEDSGDRAHVEHIYKDLIGRLTDCLERNVEENDQRSGNRHRAILTLLIAIGIMGFVFLGFVVLKV